MADLSLLYQLDALITAAKKQIYEETKRQKIKEIADDFKTILSRTMDPWHRYCLSLLQEVVNTPNPTMLPNNILGIQKIFNDVIHDGLLNHLYNSIASFKSAYLENYLPHLTHYFPEEFLPQILSDVHQHIQKITKIVNQWIQSPLFPKSPSKSVNDQNQKFLLLLEVL